MSDNEIRIGVFICHCGTNIGGVLDISSLTDYAKTLPNVVYAADNLYTCSEGGLNEIRENIKEHNLNRVIVASCSPRTHEPLFRATCQEAGLNPYLFEMVNIRDQDSWVHMKEPEKGTEKAKDLIRMGVYKAALLEPLEKMQVGVTPSALVIGGGISGMNAALNLANQNFEVNLIEKDSELGGLIKYLNKVFPTNEDASNLLEIRNLVESHKKINVYKSAILEKIEGYVGNYKVNIRQNNNIIEFDAGVIIVATGAIPLSPDGYYDYNGKNIISQLELEELLKENKVNAKNVVMIQCVGCRNEERKYCSNICCMTALKNGMLIKEQNPDAHINIIFRDIQTQGVTYEEYYRKAREMGILFIKYLPEKPPIIKKDHIEVYNEYMNQIIGLPYDLIVLSMPLIANEDSEQLAKMLKVPLEENKFFLEAHVKLRPVEFATDGVFLCGSAHWPADISESISQSNAAASRATTIISKDILVTEGVISKVDPALCIGCNRCAEVCNYGAIGVKYEEGLMVSEVNPLLCKGCGDCAAECPAEAITISHFGRIQIEPMITEAAKIEVSDGHPRIVAFLCNWCSYAGADLAGVSRYQYPPNIRTIRVMCSGGIPKSFIYQAFLNSADGVFIGGCHLGDCHYIAGNQDTLRRTNEIEKTLGSLGINPERFLRKWISASEGKLFAQTITDFTEKLKELGPIKNDYKKKEVVITK